MKEVFIVFFVQSVFMFFIDHKYRFLSDGSFEKLILFQSIIATMYVFVIPMIARCDTETSLAYIFGSVAWTYISHKVHKASK